MANVINANDDFNQQQNPIQSQNIDDTSAQPVQPAQPTSTPLGFGGPSAFESPVSINIQQEQAPHTETKTEHEAISEISAPAPIPAVLQQQTTPPQVQIQPKTPKVNVVHEETNNERLHSVGKTADSITTLADKEEEKFITEIEAHHKKN